MLRLLLEVNCTLLAIIVTSVSSMLMLLVIFLTKGNIVLCRITSFIYFVQKIFSFVVKVYTYLHKLYSLENLAYFVMLPEGGYQTLTMQVERNFPSRG